MENWARKEGKIMEENNEKDMLPELVDIRNRILAYNTVHPEGCFIFRFVGFKDSEEICEECGEKCMYEYNEKTSDLGIHGDIETIRNMLNELRDIAEEYKDENGFVNF